MLYWQKKSDPLLVLCVDRALEISSDHAAGFAESDPEGYAFAFPWAARSFTLAAWRNEIRKLKAANLAGEVYALTDYHWLLLHEVLEQFCEDYNAGVWEPLVHEGTTIENLDFDGIVGLFFWDTDFLLDFEHLAALGPERRQMMGFNEETLGLAAGLAPHPDELVLDEVAATAWREAADEDEEAPAFVPGCGTYPVLGE